MTDVTEAVEFYKPVPQAGNPTLSAWYAVMYFHGVTALARLGDTCALGNASCPS